MKTILVALCLFLTFATQAQVQAETWNYKTHSGRHSKLKIQNEGGIYKISGLLYYTDGYFEGYYPWSGTIQPNSIEQSKIVVQNAMGEFRSGTIPCKVPIEIILHLPNNSSSINNFYIEYKIPVKNVDDIGNCKNHDYDWHRDLHPYQVY